MRDTTSNPALATESLVEVRLKTAQAGRVEADDQYYEAITYAVEQNWSNRRIGRAVGRSEAAIRQYRGRRDIR